MTTQLLGDEALERALFHLGGKGSKRAIAAGLRASMTPVAKALRAAINASDASPAVKRAARKSVGQRFRKTRRTAKREAKVGFGVGKKRGAQFSRNETRGVGISANNIHWFVLGTEERHTKSGKPTGRIQASLAGLIEGAVGSSASASLQAARRKITAVIEKEARRS